MEVDNFLEKKPIVIDGTKFMLSLIPAIQSQEIYGKLMRDCKDDGDLGMTYMKADTAKGMLQYTAYESDGVWLPLDNEYAINEACKKIYTLLELEVAMVRYNYGFLFDGRLQKVLESVRGEEADTSNQE